MKRKSLLLLPALFLASCSKNNTKGLVECSFISIDSQQNYEVFYYTIMPVFEYQSDGGKTKIPLWMGIPFPWCRY